MHGDGYGNETRSSVILSWQTTAWRDEGI